MFDHPAFADHEDVHVFQDKASGLQAIIAVHSTVRGPAAGGCRMWAYSTGSAALTDALRLSEGMSYKNAMAGLDLGGGKAVIVGNPRTAKSPKLFRALGRAVDSLQGRYWTAEDVGVSPADMAFVRETTRFVAGLASGQAASGDPSPVTARGVFLGIRTCLERAFGSDELRGRTIAVQGLGHVGGGLCELLAEAGARLVVADINADAVAHAVARFGATAMAPSDIHKAEVDVFSPNALGAGLNETTIPELGCRIVAGGANNQLSSPVMGEALARRGIMYAPDYVINGGGIINVAAEISGKYEPEWVEAKLQALNRTLADVLDVAAKTNVPSNLVADDMARRRIREST